MHRIFFSLTIPAIFFTLLGRNALLGGDQEKKDQPPTQFNSFKSDVLPLLQAKCSRCHDAKTHKADLDLSTYAGIMKGGESGAVVVPSEPKKSAIYEKVHSGKMPPDEKDRLSTKEIETIQRWIAEGAKSRDISPNDSTVESSPTQHDVIPIMLRRCTVCHGLHRKQSGLDLRNKAAMLRGGKSGPAITPGKPGASLVLKRIHKGQMPPRDQLVVASVKPMEQAEIDLLSKWIALGAPESDIAPDVATTTPDPLVSEKDREFWAFRAPNATLPPRVHSASQVRNPIDAYILRKLEEKGLTLAPEADRLTLIRRTSFDLTGLPPEPADVQAFLNDRSPDAYEKWIDRLLASPRYGERWGRYWLDLAGYADSEGKREQDLPRPHAWRYRDYVIRSFNNDKPYSRFLLEQLAGDELADYEHAPEITSEMYDNLVATGFLRMAPDGTWANITGFLPDRIEVIADEIDVLGSSVLGLTLKCARCHSHKFDPIPHRDYYRLVDIFKGAYDEFDWLRPDIRPGLGPISEDFQGGRHLPFVATSEKRAWQVHNDKIQQEIAKKSQILPEPRIQALWDRGEPSPTYIYRRGDPLTPGRQVGPGVPSVLTDGKSPFVVTPPWPNAKKTGRRLAFAKWLIEPNHPLTARVAVNRIWKHHFRTGIVKSLGNFGKAGSPPTHPELLDWLARELVRQGWSIKSMHRLIMTSSTYRQSSTLAPEMAKLDPDDTLYSRMPLVRLDAESLYDTLLLVSGRLDETRFGPADDVQVRPDGFVSAVGTTKGWRRLIYVKHLRKDVATHLEVFDYPQMNPNCLERRDSTVAPQALHLMNTGMVHDLSERFAERVSKNAGTDLEEQVKQVYWIALSRVPSKEEKRLGINALSALSDRWAKQLADSGKPDSKLAAMKALTTYCHTIMNSAQFHYVD